MCVSAVSRGDPSGARSPFFEQGVSRASRARSRSCASGSSPRTFLYPVGPPLSEERCVGRRVGVWHDPLWFQILAAPPMVRKILNQLLSCRNPLVPPGPTGLLVPEGRPVWFKFFTLLVSWPAPSRHLAKTSLAPNPHVSWDLARTLPGRAPILPLPGS